MQVTKSITFPNISTAAYEALTTGDGPLAMTMMVLLVCTGASARAFMKGANLVFEASGPENVVDYTLEVLQRKVPEYVALVDLEEAVTKYLEATK